MMLNDLVNKISGFCENKKINSIPLYLIKDISDLDSTDLITKEQKYFLKSAFRLETDNFGFFPDKSFNLAGAIAIIKNSQEPRKSIIDQAAIISKKIPKKKWALRIIGNIEDKEISNFFLGWGLSFYQFNIDKTKNDAQSQSLCLNEIKKLLKNRLFEKGIAELKSIFLTRDLINLPPNYLTPKKYTEIIKTSLKPLLKKSLKVTKNK